MLRHEDAINIDNFTKDSIDGYVAVMERGKLGLRRGEAPKVGKASLFSLGFLEGHGPDMDKMPTDKKDGEPGITNGHTSGHINGHTNDHTNGHTNAHPNAANGTNGIHESNGAPKTSGGGFDKLLHPILGDGLSLDESSRHFLMNSLNETAEKWETPRDTMRRLVDSV